MLWYADSNSCHPEFLNLNYLMAKLLEMSK